MDIDEAALEIRKIAIDHGWEDSSKTEGDWAALAHSEISEAFEEYRNGYAPNYIYYGESGKPEGMAVEYIDCVIRILHWFAYHNIIPSVLLRDKMEYNKTREYRHGGKVL